MKYLLPFMSRQASLYLRSAILLFLPLSMLAREPLASNMHPKALSFIENKGQIADDRGKPRNDIKFRLDAPGMTVFAGKGVLYYQWNKPSTDSTETYRMDVELLGANKNAEVIWEEQQAYFENYYLPQCPEGVTAHTFNRVTYKNIYPNIDWVLYTKNNELKYDFVVHAGGDPAAIKLKYTGATKLELKEGAVIATTPFGSITEQKPYSYEAETGKEVRSAFVLDGNILTCKIAEYSGKLIIDPTIHWATYYGGWGEDGEGLYADAGGNVYMATHSSQNNMASTGAYKTSPNGWDGLLVKFNAAGARQWATYFGGISNDWFNELTCDSWGNIYVTGLAGSSNLATTGAHQTSLGSTNGGPDALLVKFSASGGLLWSTYYGGADADFGYDVATDQSGNVYMCGATRSTTNIASSNGNQTTYGGHTTGSIGISGVNLGDGFIAKFSSNGVRQWGSYFGGSGADVFLGLACDAGGNIYACGATYSSSGISTTGTHQSSFGGGATNWGDAVLAKFSGAGSVIWATYYGGTYGDVARGVDCDLSGNTYITGETESANAIANTTAQQAFSNGLREGFIAKFNPAGVRQWGTYFGGSGEEFFNDVTASPAGSVYICGHTTSTSNIATAGAYQGSFNGGSDDGCVAEFSSTGTLLWASYFGGHSAEDNEHGDCAFSTAGYLFISGPTASDSSVATPGAFQTARVPAGPGPGLGGFAAYIACFKTDTTVYILIPFTDTLFCPGDTLRLGYGVNFNFKAGNIFTAQLSDASGSFATPINIGTKTAVTGDTIVCVIPMNTVAGTGYRVRVTGSNPVRVSEPEGLNIRVKSLPTVSATSNAPVCAGATINFSSTTTSGSALAWSGPVSFTASSQSPSITNAAAANDGDYVLKATLNGCTASDTVTVVVKPIPPIPTATNNGPLCPGDTLMLTSSSTTAGVSYTWSGPGSFTSGSQDPSINNITVAQGGSYNVTATLNGCTSAAGATTVVIKPVPATPSATSNSPICAGGVLNLNASSTTVGVSYSWTGPNGFTSNLQTPAISPAGMNNAGVYDVIAGLNGCLSDTGTTTVSINNVSSLGVYPSPNDTLCANNASASFVAVPFNAGVSPQYQWFKNNNLVGGATAITYPATSIADGDSFYCRMTVTGLCADPLILYSNKVGVTVLPLNSGPSVTITADPGLLLSPWQLVKFTAVATNAGAMPRYQWKRNSQDVIGAMSNVWSANNLSNGDTISCVVTSDIWCATPSSAVSSRMVVNIKLGIDDITGHHYRIYPNPVTNELTIEGEVGMKLSLVNVLGQEVYSGVLRNSKEIINTSGFAPGSYILQLTGRDGARYVVKMKKL